MTGGNQNFRFDPNAVKAQAPAFSQLAQELTGELSKLMQSMDSFGACWGNDAYGEAFGRNYSSKASEALGMIQAATTLFSHMGNAATANAHAVTNTDQAIGDAMKKIINDQTQNGQR